MGQQERLLERRARADICNSSGETPVHWAAKSSNIAALDTLTRGDRSLLSMRDCDGFTWACLRGSFAPRRAD